jgi:hypothetical protein
MGHCSGPGTVDRGCRTGDRQEKQEKDPAPDMVEYAFHERHGYSPLLPEPAGTGNSNFQVDSVSFFSLPVHFFAEIAPSFG